MYWHSDVCSAVGAAIALLLAIGGYPRVLHDPQPPTSRLWWRACGGSELRLTGGGPGGKRRVALIRVAALPVSKPSSVPAFAGALAYCMPPLSQQQQHGLHWCVLKLEAAVNKNSATLRLNLCT